MTKLDLKSLIVSDDFDPNDETEVLQRVDVRKPKKQEYVRVHTSPEMCITIAAVITEENQETYLVPPDMRVNVANEYVVIRLHVAMNRDGEVFLWPLKLQAVGARPNPWTESMARAIATAKQDWVRVSANMAGQRYNIQVANNQQIGNPWRENLSMEDLVSSAFEGRVIDTDDHPVSSPGESHPQALSEPDLNLSAHPAPIIQSMVVFSSAIGKRALADDAQGALTNAPPYGDASTF